MANLPKLPKLKNFRGEMDQVSRLIKDAEARLRESGCTETVCCIMDSGDLTWEKVGGAFHITHCGEILANARFATRVRLVNDIPRLMVEAERAMENAFRGRA